MEIWDSGMPPREEALAAVKELSRPEEPSVAIERRRLLDRIPTVAWLVAVTVLMIVLVAWLIAQG